MRPSKGSKAPTSTSRSTSTSSGDEGGNVDVSVSGPFQSKGEDQLPELDLTAKANGSVGGKDVDFDGGLVLVPNKAYVSYEGEDYEVDPTTFSFVQSAIEEAQQKSGAESGTEGATKCQEEAAGKFSAEDFVDNLTNEGCADVGGTETTKVSGDLDVGGALEALTELTEIPACSSQLEAAGPLPLGRTRRGSGRNRKGAEVRPRGRLRRRRQHRPPAHRRIRRSSPKAPAKR